MKGDLFDLSWARVRRVWWSGWKLARNLIIVVGMYVLCILWMSWWMLIVSNALVMSRTVRIVLWGVFFIETSEYGVIDLM